MPIQFKLSSQKKICYLIWTLHAGKFPTPPKISSKKSRNNPEIFDWISGQTLSRRQVEEYAKDMLCEPEKMQEYVENWHNIYAFLWFQAFAVKIYIHCLHFSLNFSGSHNIFSTFSSTCLQVKFKIQLRIVAIFLHFCGCKHWL